MEAQCVPPRGKPEHVDGGDHEHAGKGTHGSSGSIFYGNGSEIRSVASTLAGRSGLGKYHESGATKPKGKARGCVEFIPGTPAMGGFLRLSGACVAESTERAHRFRRRCGHGSFGTGDKRRFADSFISYESLRLGKCRAIVNQFWRTNCPHG